MKGDNMIALRQLGTRATVFAALVSLGVTASAARTPAIADVDVAPPNPAIRPMPADPPRADNIGGAKVSSSAPQGEDNGMGQPLAAATSLSTFTMPMFAKDGVFFPTVRAGSNVVIHLPNEMRLQPAQWAGDGGATYTSNDVDYQVIPYSGGGGDIVVHRKSISSPSDMQFGVRLPANTHLRQGDNAFLLETDPAPGNPASVIGTFSVPVAHDSNGVGIAVTPTLAGGFPNQTNISIDLGPANILAFPVDVMVAYRASNIPTVGALSQDWAGVPPGATAPQIAIKTGDYVLDTDGRFRPDGVDPALYAQRHSGVCQGGPSGVSIDTGRSVDFTGACRSQQMCLDITDPGPGVDLCNNALFANMSAQCVAAVGQSGSDYDTCVRVANDETRWVKENMRTGKLCQPVTPDSDITKAPSNGNSYCRP